MFLFYHAVPFHYQRNHLQTFSNSDRLPLVKRPRNDACQRVYRVVRSYLHAPGGFIVLFRSMSYGLWIMYSSALPGSAQPPGGPPRFSSACAMVIRSVSAKSRRIRATPAKSLDSGNSPPYDSFISSDSLWVINRYLWPSIYTLIC